MAEKGIFLVCLNVSTLLSPCANTLRGEPPHRSMERSSEVLAKQPASLGHYQLVLQRAKIRVVTQGNRLFRSQEVHRTSR